MTQSATAARVWSELVSLDALGVLPMNEAGRVRAHLRTCGKCLIEYQLDRAAADMLGYLSDDGGSASMPSRPVHLKARVMRAARVAREPQPQSKPAPQDSAGYAHLLVDSDAVVEFRPGIKWAVTRGDGVTLIKWVLEPPACGHIEDELHALFTQSGVVIEGSFSMRYDDGTVQRLGKQDVYMIPPGTVHGADFHERTVLLDVYTPNHTKFEEKYLRQLRKRNQNRN
jgi:quercetin dioxygenase-like cupin family protein